MFSQHEVSFDTTVTTFRSTIIALAGVVVVALFTLDSFAFIVGVAHMGLMIRVFGFLSVDLG